MAAWHGADLDGHPLGVEALRCASRTMLRTADGCCEKLRHLQQPPLRATTFDARNTGAGQIHPGNQLWASQNWYGTFMPVHTG